MSESRARPRFSLLHAAHMVLSRGPTRAPWHHLAHEKNAHHFLALRTINLHFPKCLYHSGTRRLFRPCPSSPIPFLSTSEILPIISSSPWSLSPSCTPLGLLLPGCRVLGLPCVFCFHPDHLSVQSMHINVSKLQQGAQ